MKTNTTQYVVGFLLDRELAHVVLIRKNRGHESLIDRWNGPGGKIEPGESPEEAMVREFREETGIDSSIGGWKAFAYRTGQDAPDSTFEIFYFVSYLSLRAMTEQKTQPTDEKVAILPTAALSVYKLAPEVEWMVAYLRDAYAKEVTLYDSDKMPEGSSLKGGTRPITMFVTPFDWGEDMSSLKL